MSITNPSRDFKPTSLTPHVKHNSKLCIKCGSQHPANELLSVYPVIGLEYWYCGACQRIHADTVEVQHAKLIARAKSIYLERSGYKAPKEAATRFDWVAYHSRLKKGIAFVNDDFDRNKFKDMHAEAERLGFKTFTVLVIGLVKYSGAGITAIRVEKSDSFQNTLDDIQADLMADVRAITLSEPKAASTALWKAARN